MQTPCAAKRDRSEKTLDSFGFDAGGLACAAHLFQAGTNQCVYTFLVRVTRLSLDPTLFDGMAGSHEVTKGSFLILHDHHEIPSCLENRAKS
jgi:hypothetical protein